VSVARALLYTVDVQYGLKLRINNWSKLNAIKYLKQWTKYKQQTARRDRGWMKRIGRLNQNDVATTSLADSFQ
jgi:hypothetical protein